jgi:DNA-binding response OmpR family regulator
LRLSHSSRSVEVWHPFVSFSKRRMPRNCPRQGCEFMRILLAEDDRALVMFLTRGMEADGHRVRAACDGAEALEAFRNEMPDLTILDLNLPVLDGEQVLVEMRALDPQLPVLVLTGRQEVETRIRCLDLGADDLMVKPFSLHELRARCRALLRRKREARLTLRAGDLEVDRLDHTARRAGELISLTNKEFALLEHLMLNRGQCISRVDLLDAVWNMEPAQTTNIVDVYVNYLRRKLKDPPPGFLLRTVRGQGYLIPAEAEIHLPVPLLISGQAGLAGRPSAGAVTHPLPMGIPEPT